MRMKYWQRLLADTSGAVLMEYVMLGVLLMGGLVFGADALFKPDGGLTGDFGLLGNAFMDWYHRIIDTVALPVP